MPTMQKKPKPRRQKSNKSPNLVVKKATKATHMKILAECPSCNATGLYKGMYEGPNIAVICMYCNGSGSTQITLRKFTKRKRLNNTNEIRTINNETLTYKQFQKKFPQQKPQTCAK
jgi:hypothetical protein